MQSVRESRLSVCHFHDIELEKCPSNAVTSCVLSSKFFFFFFTFHFCIERKNSFRTSPCQNVTKIIKREVRKNNFSQLMQLSHFLIHTVKLNRLLAASHFCLMKFHTLDWFARRRKKNDRNFQLCFKTQILNRDFERSDGEKKTHTHIEKSCYFFDPCYFPYVFPFYIFFLFLL